MEKIKILIVEDHPLMRQSLEAAILTADDMEVVGQAANGVEALQLWAETQPDVILLDLLMPKMNGIETMTRILAQDLQAKILVVTSVDERNQIMEAITAGAMGYITKDIYRDELIRAIRTVQAGSTYLEAKVTEKMVRVVRQKEKSKINEKVARLSNRQREIFDLLGQGLSSEEIAANLNISTSTVRVHTKNMIDKLNLRDRQEVVVVAVRYRLERG